LCRGWGRSASPCAEPKVRQKRRWWKEMRRHSPRLGKVSRGDVYGTRGRTVLALLVDWRLVVPVLAMASVLVWIVVAGETPAGATTADSAGLPVPKKKMPVQYGHPLVGRNFVYSVAGKAHVVSGVLDIEGETEGLEGERVDEWFYGELELRLYEGGKPETLKLSLYPFRLSSHDRVTAGLVPPASITPQHEEGVPIGYITFKVPQPTVEFKTESELPKFVTTFFTLNGRGPYEMIFKRGNDDAPPPAVLPKAKRIQKKAKRS
jgi:hypothetical protein